IYKAGDDDMIRCVYNDISLISTIVVYAFNFVVFYGYIFDNSCFEFMCLILKMSGFNTVSPWEFNHLFHTVCFFIPHDIIV
ncbi:MAG: hypothetical protein J7L82_03750, partial [Staphylothermus sp.]|nr:hypothetical protein [Staphylothermus sp.]